SIIPEDHGLVCRKCWKANFQAKLCTCSMGAVDGIGRRHNSVAERVFNEEIPCPMRTGDCNNGEIGPSKLGLDEALRGDPSTHVGQAKTMEKEWENPKKKAHASNNVDSESSKWETRSEDEENAADLASKMMEVNRQSISNKDPKKRLLNAHLNCGKRMKDSSGEKIALLTLEARDPNFDSPKLKGNLEVVMDVEDENNLEWSTVNRKSYHGFCGGGERRCT
ncbi:hypothetical protein KI387_003157, partial [Taxus chinensis]